MSDHPVMFWSTGLVSAFLLALSTTEKQNRPIALLLLGAGVLSLPLAEPLITFATQLSHHGTYNAVFHTHFLPLLLLMLLIAVGVAGLFPCSETPSWHTSLSTIVLTAIIAGVLATSSSWPAKLGTQCLIGLLILPLVQLGLWMGSTLKQPNPKSSDRATSTQQGLNVILGIVLMAFIVYLGSKINLPPHATLNLN